MIREKLVNFFSLALAVSFLSVNAVSVQAQTLYGTIQGQVQDQQGAVIGKAEITVRNLETGAVRKVNANDAGAYQVTSIPPGSYELTASIAGFKIPKSVEFRAEPIPLSGALKPLKRELRAKYWAGKERAVN